MTNPGPWRKAVPARALLGMPCLFGLFRCPVAVNSYEWVDTRTPPAPEGDGARGNPNTKEADDDRR